MHSVTLRYLSQESAKVYIPLETLGELKTILSIICFDFAYFFANVIYYNQVTSRRDRANDLLPELQLLN